MDWGRAKTVLIFAFFVLNLILGYELWLSGGALGGPEGEAETTIEDIRKLLSARGIRLDVELPARPPRFQKYVLKLDEASLSSERTALEPPVPAPEGADAGEVWRAAAIRVDKGDEYEFDVWTSDGGVFVGFQLLAGVPVFGVELKFFRENGAVVAFHRQYAQPISEEGGEQPVLSAPDALRRLLDAGAMPEGTSVRDVRFGLLYRPFEEPEGLTVPAWRVVLDVRPTSVGTASGQASSAQAVAQGSGNGQQPAASTRRIYFVEAYHGEVSEVRSQAANAG